MIPRILSNGGVDPCGGAGLALDARVAQALGAHAMIVPACLTVQDRTGFQRVAPVDRALLEDMLAAVLRDGPVHGVKIGMLGSIAGVEQLGSWLAQHGAAFPVVLDPVLSATAGGVQWGEPLGAAYLEHLVPRAPILTPNLPEIAVLGAADQLLQRGCRAVLVKGGHGAGEVLEDVLVQPGGTTVFRHPALDRGPVHGTGCALATALAVGLCRWDLVGAARWAIEYVNRCLEVTAPGTDGVPTPLAVAPAPQ